MTTKTDENAPADADVTVKMIAIDKIYTAGLQVRVRLNPETVDRYVEALDRGDKLPPPVVFYSPGGVEWYFLGAGMHRLEAHKRKGRKLVEVEAHLVPEGKNARREALLYALGDNAKHGLPMSAADKKKAVELLLEDPEWRKWSDRKIARYVGASNTFVGNLREQLKAEASANCQPLTDATHDAPRPGPDTADAAAGDGNGREDPATGLAETPAPLRLVAPPEPATRKFERGGKTHEMRTGNIGAKQKGGKPPGPRPSQQSIPEWVHRWAGDLDNWIEAMGAWSDAEFGSAAWRDLERLEAAARKLLDRLKKVGKEDGETDDDAQD
jgi:hypothetical protein